MSLCVYHQMVWGPGPSCFMRLHVYTRFVHPSHGCLLVRLCPWYHRCGRPGLSLGQRWVLSREGGNMEAFEQKSDRL